MFSLILRNFIFTILQPGLVAGLIPYLILGDKANNLFDQPIKFYHYFGAALIFFGLVVMFSCIIIFAVKGRGTISPVDQTKLLVVNGFYRFSRNPMYVGVMMILSGEAIIFQSVYLCIYLLIVFTGFNLFILLNEEPRLRKDFGDEYINYCQRVNRWF